jgi:hypothetical protein
MAKKAPAKKLPAKRKPRAVKPVDVDVPVVDTTDYGTPIEFPAWLATSLKVISLLAIGSLGGIWVSGGIEVGPGPVVRNDVLQQSYDSDRITQAGVLRDLAKQPFDGTTDDGRKQAGEWFNAQRFHNRANDFGAYTDAVSEAIAANSEDSLATELEAK